MTNIYRTRYVEDKCPPAVPSLQELERALLAFSVRSYAGPIKTSQLTFPSMLGLVKETKRCD